jgi:hypothetical protein
MRWYNKAMITRFRSAFLVGVLLFSLLVQPAAAASLYMDPAFSSVGSGDAITVSVRLDTDEQSEECINAVDAVIKYSDNIMPVDVSIGESIFSIWVEQPKIDTQNKTITFAGGIPNGYCGRIPGDPRLTNTLVKMVFRAPGLSIGQGSSATNTAKIEFAPETTAYENDGFGTKAILAMYGAAIDVSKFPSAELKDPWRDAVVTDNIPPEKFSIAVQKDELAFGGEYFIAFNTTDKQTGIDRYEIMEEPSSQLAAFDWGRADAPWKEARSPYILKDQSLNSVIRVKAIDKAGNEYIATLVPEEGMRGISMAQYIMWGVVIVLVLGLAAIGVYGYRVYKRHKKQKAEADPDLESK